MLNEFLLILLVVMVAVFGAVVVFFLLKLLLKIERSIDHFDRVLTILEEELPRFTEQSERTLKAIEESSRAAQQTLQKLSRPLDVLTSKPAWQAVSGLISGFGAAKKLFRRRKTDTERETK